MNNIYVTAFQSGGGSYGHKLSDIVSAYLFAEWLGAELLAHKTWHVPELKTFNISSGLRDYNEVNTETLTKHVSSQKTCYGMSLQSALRIRNRVMSIAQSRDVCLVLKLASRIILSYMRNWYHRGKIDKDVYTQVLRDLRERFYERNPEPTGRLGFADVRVACFIRRAFMAYVREFPGNSFEFYSSLVDNVRKVLFGRSVRFTFFTQRDNSDDVERLADVPGVRLIYDGDYSDNMSDLVYSDVYVGSHSASSTWAAYFATGVVMVPTNGGQELPRTRGAMKRMDHVVYPDNFLPVEPDGSFDGVRLLDKLETCGRANPIVLV